MAINTLISSFRKHIIFKTQAIKQLPYFEKHLFAQDVRLFSSETGKVQSVLVEGKIQDILRKNFPSAEYIEVRDVSGGCGAMFEISVIAEEFKGLTIVKQHRMVNEALKEEIKDMHGLRINTRTPSKPS